MAAATADKPSIHVGALGLGQAGGNLAAEMHHRGHPALAINTAATDLRSLGQSQPSLPEDARLNIGLQGVDGAGQDPEHGRRCLEENAARIVTAVKSRFAGVDMLLVMAGLGGGTGSNAGVLLDILKDAGLPLGVLATLPAPSESALSKVNAVQAVGRLTQDDLLCRIFVDNKRVLAHLGDRDVLNYFREGNAAILEPLDALNRLNSRTGLRSIKSVDGEDLRRAWLSGGVLVPSLTRMEPKAFKVAELEKQVLAALDGGLLFAQGMAPAKALSVTVVLVAPEEVLSLVKASELDALEAGLKEHTGGAVMSLGVYVGKTKDVELMVLGTFSALPASVEQLLAVARKEGASLSAKVQEEMARLDTSSLKGMRLSRAPSAVGNASRPPQSAVPAAAPAKAASPAAPAKATPRQEEVQHTDANAARPVLDDGFTLDSAPPDDADALQRFYEFLVAQFQGNTERKHRDRVKKRIQDDAKQANDDVRALAVWAMVAIGDRVFQRALQTATKDTSEDVRTLAKDGLERLGAEAG